jgi:hypothetical protein
MKHLYILKVLIRSPLFHPRMRSRNLEQAFSHSSQFQQRRPSSNNYEIVVRMRMRSVHPGLLEYKVAN